MKTDARTRSRPLFLLFQRNSKRTFGGLRKALLYGCLALSPLLAGVALPPLVPSAAHATEGERVDHFEVAVPASVEEAAELLRTKVAEIETAFEAKNYHAIHEASYYVEAAVERLRSTGVGADLTSLAEVLERVHIASEQEDLSTLQEAVPRLTAEADAVLKRLS